MNAPQTIKYRGKLYRRAYSPPAPYNRTPKEVAAGLKVMQAALANAQGLLKAMKHWPDGIARTLWRIEQLTFDAHRQLRPDWPPEVKDEPADPREHFESLSAAVEQWGAQLKELQQALKGFGKTEYFEGK